MKKTIGIIQIVLGVLLIISAIIFYNVQLNTMENQLESLQETSLERLSGEENITEKDSIIVTTTITTFENRIFSLFLNWLNLSVIGGLFGLLFILEGLYKLDFKKKEVKIVSKRSQSQKNIRKV